MLGPDIIVRHVLAFVVPCGFALMVLLASRVAHFFWFRVTGVVLALLVFHFSMMIMNRLLFAPPGLDVEPDRLDDAEPRRSAGS